MNRTTGPAWIAAFGLFAVIVPLGCTNVLKPVSPPYAFVTEDHKLARWYRTGSGRADRKITACITSPVGYTISFQGSLSRPIEGAASEELRFGPGLYPFKLTRAGQKSHELCGAMLVVNVDETVTLATFGRVKETKLFSDESLKKARTGVLTSHTITFDDEPVILYWLGNRKRPSPAGRATVEMSFSGTPDVSEVRINGALVRDSVAVLDVHARRFNYATERYETYRKTHKLTITRNDGSKYVGYVRKLTPNAFAAFVQLPCAIPANLFEAADRGTISKFSVYPEGRKDEPVAEIVFGRSKR